MTMLHEVAEITHDVASICGARMQQKMHQQARDLKSSVVGLAFRLMFLKIGMLLIAAGAGFLLWGGYRALALSLSPAASALIIGGGILLIGLLCCLLISKTVSS
jgi:hypothetical protein